MQAEEIVQEAILDYLKKNKGTLRFDELRDKFEHLSLSTFCKALYSLQDKGVIAEVADNVWTIQQQKRSTGKS